MARVEKAKGELQSIIRQLMDRVLDKVLIEDPFLPEKHRSEKPLYAALVPDEIFKGSHFERRFVTPFGKLWEKLAIGASRLEFDRAESEYRIDGDVREGRLRRITEVLNRLEHPGEASPQTRVRPDWEAELKYVLGGGGNPLPTTVIADVYLESSTRDEKLAIELKAPLPNSDQTKVSKEKLLKLYAMEPQRVTHAYFALPYNPFGLRDRYNWSFPKRWFDMINDTVVLIGAEFWDRVGGLGTYETFIEAVNELGIEYKTRIYREYLHLNVSEDDVRKGFQISDRLESQYDGAGANVTQGNLFTKD